MKNVKKTALWHYWMLQQVSLLSSAPIQVDSREAQRLERSDPHAYTALFWDVYPQIRPGSRIRVAVEDVANRVVSDGFCGVIVMDVVVEWLANVRG